MPNSATASGDSTRHRLTDIEAEEVSLVDKAANKRKMLITKQEAPMSTQDSRLKVVMFEDINKSAPADGGAEPAATTEPVKPAAAEPRKLGASDLEKMLGFVAKALEPLANVAEKVKAQHEVLKTAAAGETLPAAPTGTWAQELASVGAAIAILHKEFPELADAAAPAAVVTEPAAAAAAVEPVKTDAAVPAVAATTEPAVPAPVAKASSADDAGNASKTFMDGAKVMPPSKGPSSAGPSGFTGAGSFGKGPETEFGKAMVAHIELLAKSALDLAATEPTQAEIVTLAKSARDLYMYGGVSIDTSNMEALLTVISSLIQASEAVENEEKGSAVAKRAGVTKMLTEVSARAANVGKVLKGAEITSRESKELLGVAMMLEEVAKRCPEPATPAAAVPTVSVEAIEKAIAKAIEKAVNPLNDKINALKNENGELHAKLSKQLAEPVLRASSAEPVAKSDEDMSRLFPLDYNTPSLAD